MPWRRRVLLVSALIAETSSVSARRKARLLLEDLDDLDHLLVGPEQDRGMCIADGTARGLVDVLPLQQLSPVVVGHSRRRRPELGDSVLFGRNTRFQLHDRLRVETLTLLIGAAAYKKGQAQNQNRVSHASG